MPPARKKSKNRQIYRRRCAPAKKYLQLFNTIQNKLEDSGLTIFKNKNVKKKTFKNKNRQKCRTNAEKNIVKMINTNRQQQNRQIRRLEKKCGVYYYRV